MVTGVFPSPRYLPLPYLVSRIGCSSFPLLIGVHRIWLTRLLVLDATEKDFEKRLNIVSSAERPMRFTHWRTRWATMVCPMGRGMPWCPKEAFCNAVIMREHALFVLTPRGAIFSENGQNPEQAPCGQKKNAKNAPATQ